MYECVTVSMCLHVHDILIVCVYVFAVSDLCIIAQSKDDIVVNSVSDAVCLYCISSRHEQCTYEWRQLDKADKVFVNTPVLYVKSGGLYQYTVRTGKTFLCGCPTLSVWMYCQVGIELCDDFVSVTVSYQGQPHPRKPEKASCMDIRMCVLMAGC